MTKAKTTKPRMTPSSTALAAVVQSYSAFNDSLEKSLDSTEHRIPTRDKVKATLAKIATKQAR